MAGSVEIFILILGATLCSSLTRQNLGGQWGATGGDAGIIISNATVPGGIFSDLMNSGEIGDIFYGTGDSDYSWVGLSDWTYSTTFTVDEELLAHANVHLVFEGLDTFATILINGQEVGTSQNMFVRYVFDVKQQLQVGTNEIAVQFSSPVNVAAALANETINDYVIPPECPDEQYNGICHANRIRKMQASFSWDWGPAFASVGIWKDVYLEAFNDAVIKYVVASPSKNTDGSWKLSVTTYLTARGPVAGIVSVILETENGTPVLVDVDVQEDVSIDGEIAVTKYLDVSADLVNTWWPNGYGTQDLYNLKVTFTGENEQDEKTVRVGFRTVELIQEQLEQGLSFYFKVNGYPIFAMGANEIPLSVLPERGQNRETIRQVLQTVKDVNMNMLRVWGGGVYESDYFYDLADEFGILIWHDFMFACAMYPADSVYLSNVVDEVRHQLKRLGSHTSIAVWAGNNENESALSQNWYGTGNNFDLYKNDYIKLYVDTIQPEVLKIVPGTIFITSSPTNGAESDQEGHVAQNPSDPLYGDVHFYDYGADSWSASIFPVPRFASEYGYQSMPSIESWLTATENLDDLNPTSSFMDKRQHHPQGNQQNVDLINLQLQLPDPSSENYEKAYVYFSQIVQAQSIKVETEHYRSFKGRVNDMQQGNTMGALYWQLNDVWVAPTWSGMDFTGRWKMLQYASQDFFKPMIVTGSLNGNNQLEVYAILDALEVPQNITVKGVVHIYKWESLDPLVAVEYPVTLDPLKAVLVTTIDAPTALNTAGCGSDYAVAKTKCFFHLHLMDQNNNHLVPFNYVFPEKLKNSNIANPNLKIDSVTAAGDDGKSFEIVVTTDVNALFVWLDSHDIIGRFSENGFLQVLPSKTITFTANAPVSLELLSQTLTITHLRDPAYL